MLMTRLRRDTLSALAGAVAVPRYDPAQVTAGIAHIGVGGFHRAHQAVVVDTLLNQGLARDWAIVGIGLLPQDARMRDVLAEQDHLYTVLTKHPDGTRDARVVGSLVGYVFAPDDPSAVLDVLTDPAIRIVSLTVTEGGYHADAATGGLVLDDALRAELVPGAVPTTAFGFLVEALARRRAAGVAPFSVLSCDNIPGNGALARGVVSAFAGLRDPDLGRWVSTSVAFPSSMVDRITPATTPDDRLQLRRELGVEDAWPVVCEPFLQWVLEDDLPSGRPPLEAAGVQLVPDVQPYELMKLRLLNGGHQALGFLGYLAGHRYVHEAAADPLLAAFLLTYLEQEAAPTLAPVPGVDLADYRAGLLERFGNPHIRDTLHRLCADSSDRVPRFVLPVVHDRLATGASVGGAALVVAAWARYADGLDEQGHPIEVVDQRRDAVQARARRTREDPLAFLEDSALFGGLREVPAFTTPYVEAVRSLRTVGARATVARWVGDAGSPPS